MNHFDLTPCLVFSSSDEGKILEVNTYLCKVLGYKKEDLIGKRAEIFFTVASKIFQQTHFMPLLQLQAHVEEIYLTLQKSDGEPIPVLLNAERITLSGSAVNFYAGIIVHNRKKFEDELIAAKKAAELAAYENTALIEAKKELQDHAEKLDEKIFHIKKQNDELKQFNKVVTHDMQEPIRKLTLFLGMFLDNPARYEQQKLIDKINKVSAQLKDTLKGLQQYVWIGDEVREMEAVSLLSLIDTLRDQLANEFPGVELNVNFSGPDQFNCHYGQIKVMFYHLLSNALRFRKESRRALVSIDTSVIQHNLFKTTENKYRYVDFYRIQLTDQGLGFEPEYARQVFDLFRKLHPESGLGIGLAICKKIVENHHGMISITSNTVKGTTVTIDLPLYTSFQQKLNTIKS